MFSEIKGSKEFLFTTTRIDVFTQNGKSSGTEFFFEFPQGKDKTIPLVITNKHVLKDVDKIRFYLNEKENEKQNGKQIIIELTNFQNLFINHPDENIDLCALPLAQLFKIAKEKGKEFFYKTFSPSLIPKKESLEKLQAFEEVLMLGYPVGLRDEKITCQL